MNDLCAERLGPERVGDPAGCDGPVAQRSGLRSASLGFTTFRFVADRRLLPKEAGEYPILMDPDSKRTNGVIYPRRQGQGRDLYLWICTLGIPKYPHTLIPN